jgi:hypothetical protein
MRPRLAAELRASQSLRNSVRRRQALVFRCQSASAIALYQPCPSALETLCCHLPINLNISILSASPHHTPTAMNSLFSLRCLRSAAPQITASPATSQPSTILRALQQSRSFSSTPVPQKRNRGGPKKDTRIRESTQSQPLYSTVLTISKKN